MGQRANIVVLNNNGWQLYYDHWCADRLPIELFWGPELALEFIEQGEQNQVWLNDVWCEGAALLDLRHQVLLFFGGMPNFLNLPWRRVFLDLMRENWPGWEIRWAHEGIVSLARYLNLELKPFLSRVAIGSGVKFVTDAENPAWNCTLLTLVRNNTETVLRVLQEVNVLQLGPASLDNVLTAGLSDSLVWDDFPHGGIHVDFDRHTLGVWSATIESALEEKLIPAWAGWEVNWFRDEVERHLVLTNLGIQLPHQPVADIRGQVINYLRCHHTHKAHNPARDAAQVIQKEGKTVEISPATENLRGSVGEIGQKLALLDRMTQRLQADRF